LKVKEAAYYRMPITDWPEAERPREKLMQYGPLKLTETELLAILIRSGAGGYSAIDVARKLLHQAGGLNKLAQMDYNDILMLKIKGLGKTFGENQSRYDCSGSAAGAQIADGGIADTGFDFTLIGSGCQYMRPQITGSKKRNIYGPVAGK